MNDLTTVERQARHLMTAHEVGHLDFRFSKATRAIASLHLQKIHSVTGIIVLPTMITLSRRWALVMPEHDIWEVMVHEIAHAHTANASQPHGYEFAAAVRKMGGKATKRCFSPSVNIDGSPRR